MAEKIKGTVKWFSNRKGFGFITPSSDNSPTTDDIFVHQSNIITDGDTYRSLKDGFLVEFEAGFDDNGKLTARQVTSADGTPVPPPPPREKRRKKPDGEAARRNEEKQSWYTDLDDSVKESMEARTIKVDGGRVFVAVGESRLKLGTGGYAAVAHASGLLAEGTWVNDTAGNVNISWTKALKFSGDDWQVVEVDAEKASLITEFSFTDASVTATSNEETPDTLWGEGKPNPKETLEANGFLMRKLVLHATPFGRRFRGRRNNRDQGEGGGGGAAE